MSPPCVVRLFVGRGWSGLQTLILTLILTLDSRVSVLCSLYSSYHISVSQRMQP